MSYSEEQLAQYFAHLGYDPRVDPTRPSGWLDSDRLGFLTELQARQLARVPFESISLHYSAANPPLSLDLQDLFRKIVHEGRGGYCMELNAFFSAVLRGLGFTLINTGARVMGQDGVFMGWNHHLNLVSINGIRYMVDVGFGKGGSFSPVPLDRAAAEREGGLEFEPVLGTRGRLEYKRLELHSDPTQRVWVYSTLNSPWSTLAEDNEEQAGEGPTWRPRYCFGELEYLPADYEVMNYYAMTNLSSYFVTAVLAVRTILQEEEEDSCGDADAVGDASAGGSTRPRAKGTIVLHKDEVKQTIRGKPKLLERLTSEEQRVQALEKYFGLVVSPEQAACIKGRESEIRTE
ncbi:N-acetyltransferase [Gaeumannomyces tritici R3-111a-1]|uniref:N-acetyltransferase n=1 Tax=Gaeumannomyces tritici (strain R3-111a-1) TaxID=644352 RepID=J3NUL8_GAET3|nr:N-acetyltransferase [Gaeumannomyces tritici R3-111a-1]EJT79891.1 N-acetyltransferase [Gaeumannomyces tritici R3-111a-1]